MNQIEKLIHQAHALWREGKELEMLKYLEAALDLSQKESDYTSEIEILNEYGGALRVVGQYEKAISNLKKAQALIGEYYPEDYQNYATTTMNLANAYRAKGDYLVAKQMMLEAKQLFEQNKDYSYGYMGLLNNLALIYQELNQPEQAVQMQKDAIDILQQNPKYRVPLAISYHSLYEMQKAQGISDEKGYFTKAKEILEQEVGKEHPLYAAILNSLAQQFMEQKEYQKAEQSYEHALAITKKAYGENSEAYLSVLKNYHYLQELIKG